MTTNLVLFVLCVGAEGEAPCRAEAGAESEAKSSQRVDLPTGPTRDGLRANRGTDSKTDTVRRTLLARISNAFACISNG